MSNNTESGEGGAAGSAGTGSAGLVNPHNPEFITKKPWYLTGGGNESSSAGPTLDHQTDQRPDKEKLELSLTAAEELLHKQRQEQKLRAQQGKFVVGQWVEALKKNKLPYKICKVLKVHNKQGLDLEYEDGTIERKVKINHRAAKPRVRMTKTGNRSSSGVLDAVKETYDSKRDQYHGYDRETHNAKLQQKYEQRQELRKKLRAEQEQLKKQQKQKQNNNNDNNNTDKQDKNASDSDFDDSDVEDGGDNSDDDSEEEFVQRDEDAKVITSRLARQGGVGGAQMKVTARNLRIREDTAKYLRNLDPNSAYYDPKSRSMRDNPNPDVPVTETDYAGDNFARITGDAAELARTQLFAWEASEKTGVTELHPQANPSQAELLKKQFQSKSANAKLQQKQSILQKYGGQEYLDGTGGLASAVVVSANNNNNGDPTTTTTINGQQQQNSNDNNNNALDRKLRFGVSTETEHHNHALKKPKKYVKVQCKYEEDIFINGHSTVWGSYFHKGAFRWGYADDHSLMKNSYCTGDAGRMANDEANAMQYGTGLAGSAELAQVRKLLVEPPKGGGGNYNDSSKQQQQQQQHAHTSQSKLYGEADQHAKLDPAKIREALRRQQQQEEQQQKGMIQDDKKRKYHSMNAEVNMTPEEMEAFRLRKEQRNDPMAKLSASGELLEYKK